jgi:hypothetical protein
LEKRVFREVRFIFFVIFIIYYFTWHYDVIVF